MSENIVPELPNLDNDVQPESSKEIQLPVTEDLTKEEIVAKLKEIQEGDEMPPRSVTDAYKQVFYKLRSAETESAKAAFVENGGVPEEFVQEASPIEEEFKDILGKIKDKRARIIAEDEKAKEENLAKKLQIIDAIKDLTESSDDFGKLYKDFKDLQQQWSDIKNIPQGKVKELWRSYQIYTEKFYDLLKINNELRDYDFKKNLELKTALCEAVERLKDEPDIVSAFHQLQNFHQQWREIGPVAKELRDEIWEKFKAASTAINKNYQEHFIDLKSQEENNLAEKTAIIDTLKAIDYAVLTSAKEWDEKTKEVIALQEKWKTIGFVPRKVNTQIFEEFRSICDSFFEKKAEFFRHQKDGMEKNLERKRALCEKANALKDSIDWKEAANELIAIQKEWKTIGPVPRKYSDALWKEFIGACDYFFEQKNKSQASQKEEEVANLELKKDIIKQITELDNSLEPDALMPQIRELMNKWNQIGFVPFKEKDKIYKEYQAALDVYFDKMKISKSERRLQSYKSSVTDISKADRPKGALYKERDKLMHQFNKVKAELQTYENNMGFLSVSKGSGSLLKDMNHRVENLKNELDVIVKKIELVDENLNSLEE
ncbi:DUF349 domain-containing protein [Dysgonomonas sp. 216]|uniref:DUF349 domain-containing protein n=1 Tax=Dysgonomonas sp. 216 TaxID=2302934 RepID=UPI0013D70E3D|nr:DUF349 domain-containing protein [Dysgonomonas sp. 216]NDW19557.1 DUF349 domain-containing protein [Dysgonomonas sp. 216]